MGSAIADQSRSSATSDGPRSAPHGAQRLRRRRGLPGGRAVVGGFLVAAAGVGVFAAYLDATRGPGTEWVIATRDLAPGEQLSADDLATVPVELPERLGSRAFTGPEGLADTVATAPLAEGELVQASHVVSAGDVAGREELSFPVPAERAVAGTLEVGERVDVLVTTDDATEAVVRDALLTGVDDDGEALAGPDGDLVVTLALDRPAQTLAVTHAAGTGTITLVRATARDLPADAPARFAPTDGTDG